MPILVTGAAGFIGSHVCRHLLVRGEEVVGVDNLDDHYDPALKKARLGWLAAHKNFAFQLLDIADEGALSATTGGRHIDKMVHLAAQTGFRYSLENPRAFVRSNLAGHLEVLEFCRALPALEHLVYASSSSVYGGNVKVPFSEADPVDTPVSLDAAAKKADELMSYSYAHLYGIPQTGLRFFTVYGPWGRPDMAYWLFTKAILEGKPIRVFNEGEMWRDFTFIDDVVEAVVAILDNPPSGVTPPSCIYNVGNNAPVRLSDFIDVLEGLLGMKAVRQYEPMQPGDMERTYADLTAIERDFAYRPQTFIEQGLEKFVNWYRDEWKVSDRL